MDSERQHAAGLLVALDACERVLDEARHSGQPPDSDYLRDLEDLLERLQREARETVPGFASGSGEPP